MYNICSKLYLYHNCKFYSQITFRDTVHTIISDISHRVMTITHGFSDDKKIYDHKFIIFFFFRGGE